MHSLFHLTGSHVEMYKQVQRNVQIYNYIYNRVEWEIKWNSLVRGKGFLTKVICIQEKQWKESKSELFFPLPLYCQCSVLARKSSTFLSFYWVMHSIFNSTQRDFKLTALISHKAIKRSRRKNKLESCS